MAKQTKRQKAVAAAVQPGKTYAIDDALLLELDDVYWTEEGIVSVQITLSALTMLSAAALAILVTMSIAIARAFLGPTIFDRILAVNMFGTKTVLLIALLAALADRADYIDIALVYAMINFIAVIALMKFYEYGDLGHSGKKEEG